MIVLSYFVNISNTMELLNLDEVRGVKKRGHESYFIYDDRTSDRNNKEIR